MRFRIKIFNIFLICLSFSFLIFNFCYGSGFVMDHHNDFSSNQPQKDLTLNLSVTIDGRVVELPASEVVCSYVEREMGPTFHEEALKAQAIAIHTYVLKNNKKNIYPCCLPGKQSEKIKKAVSEVIDLIIVCNRGNNEFKIAFTPYCSSVAGRTNNAKDIWGGEDTVSVESKYDALAPTYMKQCKYNLNEVRNLFKDKWGLDLSNIEPKNMFKVLTLTSGGYNGKMSVGPYNSYYRPLLKRNVDITARLIRDEVLTKLGSPKFEVCYNGDTQEFLFTSYGSGHGAGMSQYGAKLYAEKENWTYQNILNHYYPYGELKNLNEIDI